jgi:hypothetical protein
MFLKVNDDYINLNNVFRIQTSNCDGYIQFWYNDIEFIETNYFNGYSKESYTNLLLQILQNRGMTINIPEKRIIDIKKRTTSLPGYVNADMQK